MKLLNKKYRFFKKKLSDIQKSKWDLEFKIAKSRQVREGIRLDRDRAIEHLQMAEAALKADIGKEKKAEAEAQKAKAEDTIKRFEAQIKMIDDQINGIPATAEDPGQNGINDTIKSLVELELMVKDYMKSL